MGINKEILLNNEGNLDDYYSYSFRKVIVHASLILMTLSLILELSFFEFLIVLD